MYQIADKVEDLSSWLIYVQCRNEAESIRLLPRSPFRTTNNYPENYSVWNWKSVKKVHDISNYVKNEYLKVFALTSVSFFVYHSFPLFVCIPGCFFIIDNHCNLSLVFGHRGKWSKMRKLFLYFNTISSQNKIKLGGDGRYIYL